MKFYTEFLQITSLDPSIYRLTKNLILLKIVLWRVASRRLLTLVQTVFCDRLSRIAQFFSKQDHVRTAWPSVRTVFTVTPFRVRKENAKYSGTLGSVRTCCHVV
jgi:hypothetical protein